MQQHKPYTYHLYERMSRHRRQERETNFDVIAKVGEPSFQVVWFCYVVLNDIQRY